MKAKSSLYVSFAALLIAIAFAIGCTSARTDAAIAQDVQQKLLLDQAISTKQIQVASDHGVVTLTGTVATDTERNAASADAAKVEGVKTVVNNMTTGTTQAAQAAPAEQPQQEPAPEAVPSRSSSRAGNRDRRPSAYRGGSSARADNSPRTPVSSVPSGGFGSAPAPSTSTDLSQNTAPAPMTPPPPPVPTTITVPEGTELQVRLDESLDSNHNHAGDVFHGSLDQPIVLNDETVIPAHADVTGKVVEAVAANRMTGQPSLSLEVTRLSYNGHTYNIATDSFRRTGTSRGKRNVKTGAGGAALGAVIGAIAGGGKGAAIGAATGAGAGTAAGAATGTDDVRLESESIVSFRLQSPVTVTPARNAIRRASDNNGPPPEQSYQRDQAYNRDQSNGRDQNDASDRPVLHRNPQQQNPPNQQ